MQYSDSDMSYLYDMYTYSLDIVNATKDKKFYHFENDKMLRLAVERCFEILGVAATKLSDEARESMTNIPWRSIIGLRNIIAHEYGEVKLSKIWDFSQTVVPEFVKELEKINGLNAK